MCRLFGVISAQSIDAQDYFLNAPQSILYESRVDRKRLQGDGWGVGWYERGRPRIIKSPGPIYKEVNRLRRAARRARSTILIGHVRWASNPLKLPKKELIGSAHTQPFTYKKWLFAHNGTLYIPREVAATLGPLAKNIKGRNDSEVLFYWLMKYLSGDSLHDPRRVARAFRQAIRGLDAVWRGCRRRYPLYRYAYHGLNWVISDGKHLAASCFVDPGGFGKSKGLASRRQPYYQLQLHHSAERTLIASEPLDPALPWTPLHHGEIVVASAGRMTRLRL